jgi:hypothetical protein
MSKWFSQTYKRQYEIAEDPSEVRKTFPLFQTQRDYQGVKCWDNPYNTVRLCLATSNHCWVKHAHAYMRFRSAN